MIHPHTCIRHINDEMGYGIFATRFLPKGTITYVKDALEVEVTQEAYQNLPPIFRQTVDKYSYIDENGTRIVSWDMAKYVNHCCNCNTMSTGYGFEIAIRDIYPGEEITDEYGLFNMGEDMFVHCQSEACRGLVQAIDIDRYFEKWDRDLIAALENLDLVEQPLVPLLQEDTLRSLEDFKRDPSNYRSVRSLKWYGAVHQ